MIRIFPSNLVTIFIAAFLQAIKVFSRGDTPRISVVTASTVAWAIVSSNFVLDSSGVTPTDRWENAKTVPRSMQDVADMDAFIPLDGAVDQAIHHDHMQITQEQINQLISSMSVPGRPILNWITPKN